MKKIINISGLLLLAVVMMTSCTDTLNTTYGDWVGAKTADEAYSTDAGIDNCLEGVYGCLKTFPKYYWTMSEIRSDNIMQPTESRTNDYVECSQFDYSRLPENGLVLSCWKEHYTLIGAANKLLDKMPAIFPVGTDVYKQYSAEVRFLRALAYFDLVRFYSRVPVTLSPFNNAQDAFSLGQSEPEDVYKVIESDLKYAIENLSTTAYDYNNKIRKERVTKMAAKALLAKVYMQWIGYPLYNEDVIDGKTRTTLAKELLAEIVGNVNSVTNSSYWAPDIDKWGQMWYHEGDNTYAIFEVQYVCESGQGNPVSPLMRYNSSGDKYVSAGKESGQHFYISQEIGDSLLHIPAYTMYNTRNLYKYLTKDPTSQYYEASQAVATWVPGRDDNIYYKYRDQRARYIVFMGTEYDDLSGNYSTTGVCSGDEPVTTSQGQPSYVFHLTNSCSKFLEHTYRREMINLASIDGQVIDKTYWPQNFPVLRYEDMMLLYAELLGLSDDGVTLLNAIRQRAGMSQYTVSSIMSLANAAGVDAEKYYQQLVRQERRYELFGEGHRWFDEIRQDTWKQDLGNWSGTDDYGIAKEGKFLKYGNFYKTSEQAGYTAIANRVQKPYIIYPIPLQQIQAIGNDAVLRQNSGY